MTKRKVIFRVNADPDTGYGHLMRCATLADRLGKDDVEPVFVLGPDPTGVAASFFDIGSDPFALAENYSAEDEISAMDKILDMTSPSGVVVDLIQSSEKMMELVSDKKIPLLAIDDEYGNNHRADMVVNMSLLAGSGAYSNSAAKLLLGPEHILLRPQFAEMAAREGDEKSRSGIFTGFGGSDPGKITRKVIQALEMVATKAPVAVMVGEGNAEYGKLAKDVERSNLDIDLMRGVKEPWNPMSKAALAICSIGNTSWELACLGVPMIIVTISDGQAKNAEKLEQLGAAIHFSSDRNFEPEKLAYVIKGLASDKDKLKNMGMNARNLVDGHGAGRVAEKFLRLM